MSFLRRTGVKNRKKKPSLLAALCILTLFTLLSSVIGMTWAKYTTSSNNPGLANAKPFYFSSDKLSPEGASSSCPVEFSAGASDSVFSFVLRNYEDDMRITNDEIRYSATLTPASGEARTVIAETTLPSAGAQDTTVQVTVHKSDFQLEDGSLGTATLSVTTTKPYQKTLSVTLALSQVAGDIGWEVSDEAGAVLLTLQGGTGEQVTVTWPEGIMPDPLCPIFSYAEVSTEQRQVTFQAESGETYSLSFLKTNESAAFGKEQFAVSA